MEPNELILIIDDDVALLKVLARSIAKMGFQVITASNAQDGLNKLQTSSPDLLVTDLIMENHSGLELLQKAKELNPDTIVVVMTGFATVASAIEAMNCGALDYLQKPLGREQIELVIGKAIERKRRLAGDRAHSGIIDQQAKSEGIIGSSEQMRGIFTLIEKVAPTDTNVLITGESGTGKEMIAKAIHDRSLRNNRPFITVDCVSLPGNLLESELFGYVEGAFTGANQDRKGLVEGAHGGTLFLDEITELDYSLQAKLLRVLQERQIRRVGGRVPINVDFRLVAASNRNIDQAIAEGKLREDLYYRLNVVSVHLPPLRERNTDIPLLITHFLNVMANGSKLPIKMAPIAMDIMCKFPWPGNIRELRNAIERLNILSGREQIEVGDLPKNVIDHINSIPDTIPETSLPFKDAKKIQMQEFEKRYITTVLRDHGGNVSKASQTSGVDRKTLHRLMTKYSLNRCEFTHSPTDS